MPATMPGTANTQVKLFLPARSKATIAMKLISTMDKAKRSVAPNMWPAVTLVMQYSGSKTRRIAFAIAKKPQTARSQFPTFDDARPGTTARSAEQRPDGRQCEFRGRLNHR